MRAVVPTLIAIVGLGAPACGGQTVAPTRGVIERDVGGWSFRRYQAMLDVEVWVAANDAVAHSASYVNQKAERRGRLADGDVVNAMVTRYRQERGVAPALIDFARRLAESASYRVEERDLAGVRLIEIAGGGEGWVMWVARRHIVKLGGRGVTTVPGELVAAYGERFPSLLPPGALDTPLPDRREAPPDE